MDGEHSDGGGAGGGPADAEVEDEFACAEILQGSLISLHRTVERIFRVTFGIGADGQSHSDNGQMWLKLRGPSSNVKAAKLFVKGVVNQEEQQEISYPGVLHCVFCGARGLFMDSLIKSTSAHIVVGSPGFLLISGLAEPVVRAYSLITELIDRYEGTQSRRAENGDRGSGESLDSRRAFKALVEKWDDRHILDLLLLPWSVKEVLLDLVKESGLGSSPVPTAAGSHEDLEDTGGELNAIKQTLPDLFWTPDEWTAESRTDSAAKDSFIQSYLTGARGIAEGAEERLTLRPQEVGEEGEMDQGSTLGANANDGLKVNEQLNMQFPIGNKEFWLLLKFFTAMGYTEDVVKRVLARTGPKEASQILDLVQQEQDRSEQERKIPNVLNPNVEAAVTLDPRGINRPCETEHREEYGGDIHVNTNGKNGEEDGNTREIREEGSADVKGTGPDEDFVLGVVKKAAASCGYAEQNVTKFYNMLPDRSTHQLLLELQREETREGDAFDKGPKEMDDVVLEKDRTKSVPAEVEGKEENERLVQVESKDEGQRKTPDFTARVAELNFFTWKDPNQLPKLKTHQTILPEVKGPPMTMYTSSLDPDKQQAQNMYWLTSSFPKQSRQNHNVIPKPRSSNSSKQVFPAPQSNVVTAKDSASTKRKGSSVVVTGEQRFLEGLLAPFQLKLTDDPGDPTLRTIIVDGSNVAMSHGLGHFFSCRGIALAVQHFWDRGHRHISALVPQWRQKSDPKIKEQHYLSELQKLGLLSYTPSREVQGKRIASYDDRLMLQLAEKTNGVIVTNDNLRDLLDESRVFKDIIKKRLLQYTFVGDHFMVPDDPLGRGGPHLDDFLRSEPRIPTPGTPSFASSSTAFSPDPLHSLKAVLNFQDQILGGAPSATAAAGRGKGREHGKGWEAQTAAVADRSAEDTAALRQLLCQVFPGQDNMVTLVLQCHPAETDINVLSDLILEQQAD